MITCNGYNNPMYDVYKMWVHIIHGIALYATKYGIW